MSQMVIPISHSLIAVNFDQRSNWISSDLIGGHDVRIVYKSERSRFI